MECKAIFLCLDVIALLSASIAQDIIQMQCDPSLRHKFELCPKGYCCVRDEFLLTEVYCRRYGQIDDNCTTRDTDSECPCDAGLHCKPNLAGHFQSLYGVCEPAANKTTTMATTTTAESTTTPVSTTVAVSSAGAGVAMTTTAAAAAVNQSMSNSSGADQADQNPVVG